MSQPEKYLIEEDDGLALRESQPYAVHKLKALEFYLKVADIAVKDKPWRGRYYIDLEAGPGKNRIGNQIVLGSPLIALNVYPATHFIFNEMKTAEHQALSERVSASPLRKKITVYQADANQIVDRICQNIAKRDAVFLKGQYSVFNIAFLDPTGLELHWETVRKLAQMKIMDLIINFSTSTLLRSIGKGYYESVDRFFGTPEWRKVYDPTKGPGVRREALIGFYRQNLEQFGYKIFHLDQIPSGEYIPVHNSKNVQVYSMIFASKNELGEELWQAAAKSVKPPKLPGFE